MRFVQQICRNIFTTSPNFTIPNISSYLHIRFGTCIRALYGRKNIKTVLTKVKTTLQKNASPNSLDIMKTFLSFNTSLNFTGPNFISFNTGPNFTSPKFITPNCTTPYLRIHFGTCSRALDGTRNFLPGTRRYSGTAFRSSPQGMSGYSRAPSSQAGTRRTRPFLRDGK